MKRRVDADIHIYKITNRKNGKVYIGQTYRNVHTRFMEHMIDPESGVYADVREYGRCAFTYETLHTCLPQYADQWEHYYICKYDATNPMFGYNRTSDVSFRWARGGTNPSKTEKGKQRIRQFNEEHLDQITRGFRKYNDSRKFPVGMIDDSGEIVMTFESLNAACKYLNKPPCGCTRIKNVCDTFRHNGKRYKFYGYAWTALNENVQTNSIAECKTEDELPSE